jgi:hypothetical protein
MSRQLFSYHPRIGYTFIPNLRTRVAHEAGGYLVQTNAQGFRSAHDFGQPHLGGIRRVLVFGDSFTAADGVSNRQRYTDIIESKFRDIEVFNYALPGTGTDQQFLAYEEFAQDVSHDLLVIAVLVENIRRVNARYRLFADAQGEMNWLPKPYFRKESGDSLELMNVPVPREPIPNDELPSEELTHADRGGRHEVLRNIVRRLGMKKFLQNVLAYQPLPEYNDVNGPEWSLMSAIISHWVTKSRVPVLLMPLPLYYHVEGNAPHAPYQRRFAELAERLSCQLHDPLPDLQCHTKEVRRTFRFASDIHPTPAWHQAIAASLAPSLAGPLS